ncbi:MAG: bifunctional serine/threonine-protein kinase/formylglycine-generating enzyme family protein [Saprospiraceae bacterium]|nr:bifunctional serine/threonine-protein kinase/formylglycine-generating enzyme family protein [Saprospiraceae bacterium]
MIFSRSQEILGRYRIDDLLGQGAFGEVYRARHQQLGVNRAIKVLHRRMTGVTEIVYRHFQERFRLEAIFGAQLDSPFIVRVYDFAEENGALLLIMEYAPNGNLANLIGQSINQNKLLKIESVLSLTREIAAGLASIHEIGGVHRDLKPANILLDKNMHAKIADLGIVQLPDGSSTVYPLQQGVSHPGTPAYMSPEQRSSNKPLTPASDIFALGLILFELLTGKALYHLPMPFNLNLIRDDVPPWVQCVMRDMLDQDPGKRPANGNEVLEILTPQSRPVASAPISAVQKKTLQLPYGIKMHLVKVPAGDFLMGNNETDSSENGTDYPQHKVYLPDYWIGRYPVSITQFAAFVRLTGYVTTAEKAGEGTIHDDNGFLKVSGATWISPYGTNRVIYLDSNRPVTMISWEDAQVFCAWLSEMTGAQCRLPTEAEWEKAARGTDGRIWPWGNQPPQRNQCNFNGGVGEITPSDFYSPMGDSSFGCADMMGNIWEWTSSIFKPYPYRADDGRENLAIFSNRVLRGGSLIHDPTATFRDNDPENACYFNDGFRVVVSDL